MNEALKLAQEEANRLRAEVWVIVQTQQGYAQYYTVLEGSLCAYEPFHLVKIVQPQ